MIRKRLGYFGEIPRCVILAGNQNSVSYADQFNYCWAEQLKLKGM